LVAISWSYRDWVSTQSPDCMVEWASQLTPPNVDDVSHPLRAWKPADASCRSPVASTRSTPAEYEDPCTATWP